MAFNIKTLLFVGVFFYMTEGDPVRIILMIATMFSAFLAMIYFNQEGMLYLNDRDPNFKRPQNNPPGMKLRNPGERGMEYEDRYLNTEDGCKLHAWMIWAPKDAKDPVTLIFFHANAGNMGIRLPNVEQLHGYLGCNVFIVSYRGYGNSTGQPSEDGLCIDGYTTVKYVFDNAKELRINPRKVFLFGRSLGGAVAVQTAKHFEEQLCGIIVENTFTCIADMVDTIFPWLAYPWVKRKILRMNWDTLSVVKNLSLPMCMLMGVRDEIVPHSHMLTLFSSAEKSRYKEQYKIPNGSHNDTWQQGGAQYLDTIKQFTQNEKCTPLS